MFAAQGLRVYEQGRLLAAWQDRLSDAIQAQLAALFSSTCSSCLRLAGVKVSCSFHKQCKGPAKYLRPARVCSAHCLPAAVALAGQSRSAWLAAVPPACAFADPLWPLELDCSCVVTCMSIWLQEGSGAGHGDDGAGGQAGARTADGQPNTGAALGLVSHWQYMLRACRAGVDGARQWFGIDLRRCLMFLVGRSLWRVGLLCPAGLVLVLAKLCVHMETTTVPHVVEVLANAFQSRGFTGSDGPPRFVGGEVARRLGTTASKPGIAASSCYSHTHVNPAPLQIPSCAVSIRLDGKLGRQDHVAKGCHHHSTMDTLHH